MPQQIMSNPAYRDIIARAIQEMNASKTRIQGERDLHKGIRDRVKDTTGLNPKVFNQLAALYYQQNKDKKEEEFTEVMDAYDALFPNTGGADE